MTPEQEVLDFINSYLLKKNSSIKAHPGMRILQNEDLDSLFVIELTLFVEKQFGFKFSGLQTDLSHLQTVGALTEFVNVNSSPPIS